MKTKTGMTLHLVVVGINELKAWLESEVPELTQQYPASYGYGQDFPVSIVE